MSTQEERNKALVLEYLEAFRTFDPARYEPYLAENPTYKAGMNFRQGRDAFHANTAAGRILYPRPGEAEVDIQVAIAEGNWVAVLLMRRAVTNKDEDYENIYGMFFEVIGDKIHTQVELLDFRVAAEKFDLTALERAE